MLRRIRGVVVVSILRRLYMIRSTGTVSISGKTRRLIRRRIGRIILRGLCMGVVGGTMGRKGVRLDGHQETESILDTP